METHQTDRHRAEDDFDLMNLLERIFSFSRKFGWLIIFTSVTGMMAGMVMYKFAAKQYQSTLLLHSYTLTNTEQINIVENWNSLLKDGEYATLGKRLNCDPLMMKKVAKLSATEIQKMYIPNNPNGFVITAVVKDNDILDDLCKGVIYGFENSEFIRAKLAGRRAILAELIAKAKTEIARLDSTKRNIENSISGSARSASGVIVDVSTITGQVIGMQEKLLGYQDELNFSAGVHVLHPFEKFEKPVSPKLLKLLILGGMAGFAIGYLASVFLYVRKRFAVHTRLVPAI